MAIKFYNSKKKSIVWCIVDNRHLYQSGWAKEISINFSDFMLQHLFKRDIDVYISKDENELLKIAADEGYKHAVVVALGTSFKLSDRIFDAVDNLCKTDFFIAGHILDRGEWYYELHHQFYIVNLVEYRDLNYPKIEQGDWAVEDFHTQVEPMRSDNTLYHDKQICAWITQGTTTKSYTRKMHGWNIISLALEKDKTIIDLGLAVRNNKQYFYYEHDHVFTKEIANMYYNQFFCIHFITAWNSDYINKDINFRGPVDQYVTVGTGCNWIKNLNIVGFNKNTRVVFTDNNLNVLKFMKAMVTEWDGKNYAEFYRSKLDIIPNKTHFDIDAYVEATNTQWQEFINSFENWDELWNRIKELTYDFIHIDYAASYDLAWLEPNKNTLMNLSDLFNHVPYVGTTPLKYRIACENKLLTAIKDIDPDITIMSTSRAALGFYNGPLTMNGPVHEFEIIDLNNLNAPLWHTEDWKHTGCRHIGL